MEKIKRVLKQVEKWCDNRKIAILMAVIFVATMLPLLMVTKYSHASADDFEWGAAMRRQLWNDTHSIWQLIKLAAGNTMSMYYGWQGTFTTTFLQAFQPEIFHVNAYFIVPFLIMPFFFGGSGLLLHYVLRKLLGLDGPVCAIVTFFYFLISIQFIPSTGEAFYWFNGAVAYTLAYTAVPFCLYFCLRFLFEEGKRKRSLAAAVFCAFFVGGGNYLSLVLLPILLLLLLFLFFRRSGRTPWLLLPLLVFGVTAVINMTAPGTNVRGGEGFGFDLGRVVYTVEKSVYHGIKGVLTDYMLNPVIVICFALTALFLVAGMAGKKYEFFFPCPALFVGMTFGGYLAMYAPTYYAGVGAPFGRMCNLISFWFELSLIFDIVYVTGYLMRVVRTREEKSGQPGRWDARQERWKAGWDRVKVYVMVGAFVLIAVNPQWYRTSATVRTVKYLASGEAARFGREMDARYELLLDESKKDVVFEPLSASAGPLFLYDVGEDPAMWPNTAVAEFFHKDSVRMGAEKEQEER